MLRINTEILNFNDMRYKIYNATSITLSLFCVLGLLFVLVLGTHFADNKYNIINTVWADEINGTENADSITGTINQDTLKGLQGNDTIGEEHLIYRVLRDLNLFFLSNNLIYPFDDIDLSLCLCYSHIALSEF